MHECAGKADISEEGTRLAQKLASLISVHTFVPVALGLRKSSLHHKISGLLHAIFLSVGSLERIGSFLDSVVSVTTDLGTEAGLAEFHNLDFRDLLPEWLQLSPLEADGDVLVDRPVASSTSSESLYFHFACENCARA
jgi:hypothetical protein